MKTKKSSSKKVQSRNHNYIGTTSLALSQIKPENNHFNTTRASTSQECLDYTFRFSRAEIESHSKTKSKNKKKSKIDEHIFDLENTFSLNQDYITKLIPILEILNQSQKKQLLEHFTKIQKLYEKKKKLRKKMGELNGKILITKQIIEEAKRRNDENHLYYRDQILELNDNVSKKTSLVKQFQKKFNEVEIFIQRESQNEMNIDQWGHWKTFTIVPFLLKNENLLKLKSYYDILIEKRVIKATDLIEENKNIRMKKTINYTFSNEKRITNIQTLLASVENKTMFFERLKEQFQILIGKITKSENTPKKEVIPAFAKLNHFTEELETLPLNIDDNKQMTQGMMDMNEEEDQIKNKPITVSEVNNFKEIDKGEHEHLQNENNEPIPNENNDNWDISRIEKKE